MGRNRSWGCVSDVPSLVLRTLVGEWYIASFGRRSHQGIEGEEV